VAVQCPKCRAENPETSRFCGNCATALRPEEKILFGKTLTLETPFRVLDKGSVFAGKYKILGEIGRGGMGIVLKAEDTKLKRTVALKFLPAELTRSREAKERFIREAQAAAALDHPNICVVHEADECEGQAYIAMAHIEGESLRTRINKGPLNADEALGIAIQVAEGLEEAHKKGIVHRDIKSGNIMVTAAGQAKIMDFGLAKVVGESLITREAKTMGTLAYMSPEQAKGEAVDHRTDIWSLGVVLYEMLTGGLPFGGEQEASLLYSIVHEPHPPMRKIEPKISAGLEQVVEKALVKNPADRYQTMGEFLEDLRAIAEGLKPIRAKVRPFEGRILGMRKVYVYAGLAVLIALATLGIFALFPGRTEALDSIAILPLVNDSGDPSQDYFANSLTDRLIAEFYKVSAVRVASRQSVMAYAKTTKSPAQIARELNVKAIVEASVLKSGNRVRLIARLIDPNRNLQIWGDTFERDYSDILFLQSDLSQAIVSGIKVAVQPKEKALLASARKVNPEAYDLCLQGINLWLSSVEASDYLENELKAIDCFNKAIAIDPNLALAHAWLSHLYWELGINLYMSEEEAYPKAKAAILKALELDETLAEAHLNFAWIKCTLDWDFPGAEKEFLRALELEPGNPYVRFDYSVYLGQLVGKTDEAIARLMSLQKDPAFQKIIPYKLTLFNMAAGRFDEALKAAREAVEMDPTILINNEVLAHAYALKGMHAEAIVQAEKLMTFPGARNDSLVLFEYACIMALSGRREEALKSMEELKALFAQKHIDTSYSLAQFHAALGEKDQAFKHLYDAYQKHSGNMVGLKTNWWLHSLRDDPRFDDLLKKVGFE